MSDVSVTSLNEKRGRGRPRTTPTNAERNAAYESAAEMAVGCAADYYELSRAERLSLRASTSRGVKRVADARAMAMYLLSVALNICMTRTGKAFGRDRTTVRHALRRVEDARDNPIFDVALDGYEERLRRAISLSTS